MAKPGVDFRRLRYFIAVCEHGGFSRASSSIGIAQPALTRQIKLLEKEIGLPLINRTGRGAAPTEEGAFLLARSRQYLDGLDDLIRELRHRSSTLNGQIVLGICPTVAPFFLDDLREFLRDNHPNLTLSLVEACSGDLDNLMSRGELDLSLTYHPHGSKMPGSIDLFSERLVLVSAPSPAAGEGPRSLAAVSRMKVILPGNGHALRRIVEQVFARRGFPLSPILELDTLEALTAMVSRPALPYVTILPYHSVERAQSEGRLSCFQIDEPEMRRTVAAVLPQTARRVRLSAVLLDWIRGQSARLKAKLDTLS